AATEKNRAEPTGSSERVATQSAPARSWRQGKPPEGRLYRVGARHGAVLLRINRPKGGKLSRSSRINRPKGGKLSRSSRINRPYRGNCGHCGRLIRLTCRQLVADGGGFAAFGAADGGKSGG